MVEAKGLLWMLFFRYVWACNMKYEEAQAIIETILDEWILRFGAQKRIQVIEENHSWY